MHSDERRPSTRRGYRGSIDGFLAPAFGTLRVEALTTATVQGRLLEHKREHGARRRITLAHAVLRSALSHAQRLQLVSINAATLVTVPKQTTRRSIRPLTINEARRLLDAAKSHRLAALFCVGLGVGLRLGKRAAYGGTMSISRRATFTSAINCRRCRCPDPRAGNSSCNR